LVAACTGGRPRVPALVSAPGLDAIETRLVLLGDGGNPDPRGEPVLRAVAAQLEGMADRAVVVFLGDNVYPAGLPPVGAAGRPEAERRLAAQVDLVVRSGARGIFVPGNHDWDRGGADGWEAVRRQERYVADRGAGRVHLAPGGGCPGPAAVEAGPRLVVLALDTQWWLHAGVKPQGAESGCPAGTPVAVADSLRAAVARAAPRHVVIAAHHPLASAGPHGGYFPWTTHVFPLRALARWLWVPLPVIGSAYPLARRLGVSRQDMAHRAYRDMHAALVGALAPAAPRLYAARPEHSHQVMPGAEARRTVVSGSGYRGHVSAVGRRAATRFARAASGFMRVDVLRDGRVRLGVVVVDGDGSGREVYAEWLE
jgi:hypothetical protein